MTNTISSAIMRAVKAHDSKEAQIRYLSRTMGVGYQDAHDLLFTTKPAPPATKDVVLPPGDDWRKRGTGQGGSHPRDQRLARIEYAVRLYKQGKTISEIGAVMSKGTKIIREYLHEAGIVIPAPKKRRAQG